MLQVARVRLTNVADELSKFYCRDEETGEEEEVDEMVNRVTESGKC